MSKRIPYKLKTPIVMGSQTYEEFTLREPKAKDLRKFGTSMTMGDTIDLAATLAGVPNPVMNELSVPDLMAISEIIAVFMEGGQPTGATS